MFSFVLVQLGKSCFPNFIYDCIEQLRSFHAANPIYMVCSLNQTNIDFERLDRLDCEYIIAEELEKTIEHKGFLKKSDKKLFWQYSTERFFIIEELMIQKDLSNVVHIENDNLIYTDLNRIVAIVKGTGSGVMYPAFSDKLCMASILIVSDIKVLHKLNCFIEDNMLMYANDMELLCAFSKNHDTGLLPIATVCHANEMGVEGNAAEICKFSDFYSGIFDAASLGQFIGGTDYRTYDQIMRGEITEIDDHTVVPYLNTNTWIRPDKMKIEWRMMEKKRVPVLLEERNDYWIYNLHIHSKELHKYKSCHFKCFS